MTKSVKIWDLPLRLFHWALVLCVAFSWYTIEILEDLQLHFYSGYALLGLLLFRLFWGFAGSHYSRFANFSLAPKRLITYLSSLFGGGSSQRYPGHNPLGSLAVFAMLAALFFQVGTGLFSSDEYYFGPLAGWVEKDLISTMTFLHQRSFEVLKILIAVHILAIALYRLVKKEYLTVAMFTGRKRPAELTEPYRSHDGDRIWPAVILLLVAAFMVYLLVVWIAKPVPLDESFLF